MAPLTMAVSWLRPVFSSREKVHCASASAVSDTNDFKETTDSNIDIGACAAQVMHSPSARRQRWSSSR